MTIIYVIKPANGPVIRVVAESISEAIEIAIGHGISSEKDVLGVEAKGEIFTRKS